MAVAGRESIVAIDGPSGSGKSTVARLLARRLQWRYVDTGATYRAATLAALRTLGRAPVAGDEAVLIDLVDQLLQPGRLSVSVDPDRAEVLLDGVDESAGIRSPQVTSAVSAVSAVPEVRRRLVGLQRRLAGGRAVMEGRDVGTVVAPDAAVKVFLDATPSVRAGRRAAQSSPGVVPAGTGVLTAVEADLRRRDLLDSTRATSPLQAAPDAVHIDSSTLSVAEVVEAVLALACAAGLR